LERFFATENFHAFLIASTLLAPNSFYFYSMFQAKLVASIRWLITRVYENADIPDRLQQLFVRDQVRKILNYFKL
jgi:hypothetical protein